MKKILFLILGLIFAGSLFVFLAKDWILKIGMEQAVTRLTGFKTQVRALKYDFPSTIRVQDLEILNPPGFEEKVFAKVPEVYISFFAIEFFQGKGRRFGEIRLFVQEVHMEKNSKGVSNVELLNLAGYGPKQIWIFANRLPFLVERLELTIRNVSYEDRSGVTATSGSPSQYSMDLNIQNRVYRNIHDPQTLLDLVLFEILRRASFGKLVGLDPEKLLGGAFNVGQAFAGNMAGQASNLVSRAGIPEKAGSAIENSVHGAQVALKGTAAAAGKAASGFFGKLKDLMPEKKPTPS